MEYDLTRRMELKWKEIIFSSGGTTEVLPKFHYNPNVNHNYYLVKLNSNLEGTLVPHEYDQVNISPSEITRVEISRNRRYNQVYLEET
jgi:hypothetical protein